jgi:predicted PurR-regulated permease PerM
MNPPEYPTPWQRKTLWVAIASLSVVLIGAVGVGLIWLMSRVLGFLQPILIPFAIAGVMAYLLDPVVSKLVSWRFTRQFSVFAVFGVVTFLLVGIMLWIVPAIADQTANLARRVPGYSQQAQKLVIELARKVEKKTGVSIFQQLVPVPEGPPAPEHHDADKPEIKAPEAADPVIPADAATSPVPEPEASPDNKTPDTPVKSRAESKPIATDLTDDWRQLVTGSWARTALPAVLRNAWVFVKSSVGGFLGIFGFLLSMIIVPVYLYYFLIESRTISESWGDYLPLRASAFKDEVVSALGEINGYLIAFFRGQLIVSLINGAATGVWLMIVGLDFGLLIGLLLCFLGLIPYLGIILCWVPAVIIASVQGGIGTWIPSDPWWLFPVVVTGIFIVVQQVDGLFITPKIVGESVGLHPMTVIVSVFVWSLLMGGLLGAILAVPMTATLKVLLKRYVWERRMRVEGPPLTEESFAELRARDVESEPVRGK